MSDKKKPVICEVCGNQVPLPKPAKATEAPAVIVPPPPETPNGG